MKKYFIAIAVVAVSLASCSEKVEPVNGTDEAKYVPVEIASVGIPGTKAVVSGTSLPSNSSIGTFLCVKDQTSAYYDGSMNVKYVESSGKWSAATPLKVSATQGDLYAYYPFTSTGVTGLTINVTNTTDWMYATKQTINNTSGAATLSMEHALALVSVSIKKTSDFVGDAKLTKIKFSDPNIAASGTLNVADGSFTNATKADVSFTIGTDSSGDSITTEGTTYDCLFVPTSTSTAAQSVTLTFTINESEKSITFSADSGNAQKVKFNKGVKSTIDITLSPKGLVVNSVGVTQWTTGTSSSGTIDS